MSGGLAVVGLSAAEEQVYRLLLRHPACSVADLAAVSRLAPATLRRHLASLERAGLATRTAGPAIRFLPNAPDASVEALVRRQQAELERVRALAKSWMKDFREGSNTTPTELIEIVTGAEAVLDRFDQLQQSATEEIQVLDTPPYAGPAGPATNDAEFEVLARGVRCRAIYDRAALAQAPNAVTAILRYVAAGEEARVTNRLPLKLATFDRRVAFIPQSATQQDIASAIVVRESTLLDVLLYVFEQLWDSAVPLTIDGSPSGEPGTGADDQPSSDDRRLLVLLAGGLTDEAIAHHLGWSHRTTRRRIATLLATLGAETRFQAGLAAAHRGWLAPPAQGGRSRDTLNAPTAVRENGPDAHRARLQ